MAITDLRHLERGGRLHRVADPDWADPLDVTYSRASGGRWNGPGSFGVLYLNATVEVARANIARLYANLPYGPEDLDPDRAPVLVGVDVEAAGYVDAVTEGGLSAMGLPDTYPLDASGEVVPHEICQPMGQAAFDDAELGIACRSAAPGADGEELAWFALPGRVLPTRSDTTSFDDWYWSS